MIGFHAIDWREAFARLEAPASPSDEETDLLGRLRLVCETDPMLEIASERLVLDRGLLRRGRVDPYWFKLPR